MAHQIPMQEANMSLHLLSMCININICTCKHNKLVRKIHKLLSHSKTRDILLMLESTSKPHRNTKSPHGYIPTFVPPTHH